MRALFQDIFRHNPKQFRLILLLDILAAATASIGVVMLIPMLNVMNLTTEQTWMPTFAKEIVAAVPQMVCIIFLLIIYVVLVSFKAVLTRKQSIWNAQLVQDYTADLRKRFYQAVATSKWETFIAHKKNELVDLMMVETSRISYATTIMVKICSLSITIIVNLILAFSMSIPLTIIVILFGVLFLCAFRPIMKKSKAYGTKLRLSNESFITEINNQMNGMKEIRSYGVEQEQYHIFRQVTEEYRDTNVEYARLSAQPQMLLSIGAAVMIAGVFLFATQLFTISIGRMTVLIYVFAKLWPSLSALQSYRQTVISTAPVYEHLQMVMNELRHTANTTSTDEDDDETAVEFQKEIEFRKVCFSYASASQEILYNVDFNIRFGEITAFAGRSGAGKSTLVDLVLGFLSPTNGEVLIDGMPLNEETHDVWRKNISYIPQDPLILNESIRENLLRFHPNVTEQAMQEALKKSLAWEFVSALPNGIDTLLGDRGVRLSGGERQRIIIARALLGQPKLLVLDEATSALDYESERMIANCLRSLKGSITILLVAHRLSSIQIADHVVVVEDGKITEDGNFEDLISDTDGYLGKMVHLE